jgi:hypothetical protein
MDTTLRRLERRLRSTPDQGGAVRWLTARVAAGRVHPSALRCASALGYAPAAQTLGEEPSEEVDWSRLPPVVQPRARVALARLATDRLLRASALEPADERLSTWAREGADLLQALSELALKPSDPSHLNRVRRRFFSVEAPLSDLGGEHVPWLEALVVAAEPVLRLDRHVHPQVRRPLAEALREELVPWLLEGRDPIRERAQLTLGDVQIASPCDVPWEAMRGGGRGRYCEACKLHVFNVSGMTRADALRLLRQQTGRICIRLFRRADGAILTQDCPSGLAARPHHHSPNESDPGHSDSGVWDSDAGSGGWVQGRFAYSPDPDAA